LLVSGRDDFVYNADVAAKLIEAAGPNLTFERPAGDHFFVGMEADLVNRAAQFVHRTRSPVRMVAFDGSK
jgi:surfactin synthase thioesterase subunit